LRYPFLIFFILISICAVHVPHAFCGLKEDVSVRYKAVMESVEKQNFQSTASAEVNSRMRLVHQALSAENYVAAVSQLDQIDALIQSKNLGVISKETKLHWLELYLDLFQKIAVLALLAFFLTQPARWRTALKSGLISGSVRLTWVLLAVLFSMILRLLDLSRYGDSVWAIFDIQIVFTAILGLVGGMGWGLLGGAGIALLRWILKPEVLTAPLVILAAAVFGGMAAVGIKNYAQPGKRGFFCGAAAGFLHGCVVYLPLAGSLDPFDMAFSIGLVAFF